MLFMGFQWLSCIVDLRVKYSADYMDLRVKKYKEDQKTIN